MTKRRAASRAAQKRMPPDLVRREPFRVRRCSLVDAGMRGKLVSGCLCSCLGEAVRLVQAHHLRRRFTIGGPAAWARAHVQHQRPATRELIVTEPSPVETPAIELCSLDIKVRR